MTALERLRRLAEEINNPPTADATSRLKTVWGWEDARTPEAILALIAEVEQRDEKVERLIAAGETRIELGEQVAQAYCYLAIARQEETEAVDYNQASQYAEDARKNVRRCLGVIRDAVTAYNKNEATWDEAVADLRKEEA